jgi:coenzyme F420-reducing hydrogenase delta subunit
MTETNFEPRIVAFLCNWCSYAGADLAGVSRLQYPPSVRIIRVMCSGRTDPYIILEGFIQGVDGVFIGGCHPGDCHYLEGNYNAERKIKMTKKFSLRGSAICRVNERVHHTNTRSWAEPCGYRITRSKNSGKY